MNPVKRFFFDLETTGVDPAIHAVHQLAFIIDIDGEIVESHDIRLAPPAGTFANPQALEICNVTVEQLKGYPPAYIGINQFKVILEKYVDKFNKTDKMFLCGFNNVAFDNVFLKKAWDREFEYFYSYFWGSGLDVSVLALQDMCQSRHTFPDFKLQTVAESYGVIPTGDWHDAMTDVTVTREVYYRITSPSYRLFAGDLSGSISEPDAEVVPSEQSA